MTPTRAALIPIQAVRTLVVAVSWLALAMCISCQPAPESAEARVQKDSVFTQARAGEALSPSDATRGFGATVGFRSRQRLDEHYAKHGMEFGSITRDEYLRRAQVLRDADAGGDIVELRRRDGTVSRFDRRTGAFLAFDADGVILTFFRPNDGESYFRRQARRR